MSKLNLCRSLLDVGRPEMVLCHIKTSSLSILPERSILSGQLFNHNLVSFANRLCVEQTIHGLKRNTLGLWDEEVYEWYRQNHQAREEEVHSVRHLQEHLRGESGDEEVPEPVRRAGTGLTEASDLSWEHLTVDDPWSTVPRWGVEGGPQVEEKDRRYTSRGQRSVRVGASAGNVDVCSDVPHAQAPANGTDHQELATAEVIDEEEQPDKRERGLHNSEKPGGEETSVCAGNAQGTEDGWRVVVDGVDTVHD